MIVTRMFGQPVPPEAQDPESQAHLNWLDSIQGLLNPPLPCNHTCARPCQAVTRPQQIADRVAAICATHHWPVHPTVTAQGQQAIIALPRPTRSPEFIESLLPAIQIAIGARNIQYALRPQALYIGVTW